MFTVKRKIPKKLKQMDRIVVLQAELHRMLTSYDTAEKDREPMERLRCFFTAAHKKLSEQERPFDSTKFTSIFFEDQKASVVVQSLLRVIVQPDGIAALGQFCPFGLPSSADFKENTGDSQEDIKETALRLLGDAWLRVMTRNFFPSDKRPKFSAMPSSPRDAIVSDISQETFNCLNPEISEVSLELITGRLIGFEKPSLGTMVQLGDFIRYAWDKIKVMTPKIASEVMPELPSTEGSVLGLEPKEHFKTVLKTYQSFFERKKWEVPPELDRDRLDQLYAIGHLLIRSQSFLHLLSASDSKWQEERQVYSIENKLLLKLYVILAGQAHSFEYTSLSHYVNCVNRPIENPEFGTALKALAQAKLKKVSEGHELNLNIEVPFFADTCTPMMHSSRDIRDIKDIELPTISQLMQSSIMPPRR